ncbi:MAG: hypothetical protein ABFS34_01170 [Gemmatimonadota bacterium]
MRYRPSQPKVAGARSPVGLRGLAWAPAYALALATCTTLPDTIPVAGAPGELEQLVGIWTGDYEGESGRAGSLIFQLEASADTARGHVMMHREGERLPYARDGAGPETAPPSAAPEALRIAFVRVENQYLKGVLEPYRDPVCGCRLTTIFKGRIEGNTISGTFLTTHDHDGREETGTWRARRGR